MAKILEMPKLSPTMEEGRVAAWHKKEGDDVAIDDLLAEVETDKATMEFRSFDKGTLLKILAGEGSTVVLGQPVAILGKAGEDVGSLVAQAAGAGGAAGSDAGRQESRSEPATAREKHAVAAAAAASSASAGSATPAAAPSMQPASEPRKAVASTASSDASSSSANGAVVLEETEGSERTDGTGRRIKASPLVRKIAREEGLDLRRVDGTGPHGRIVQRDLAGAPKATTAQTIPATPLAVRRGVLMLPAPATDVERVQPEALPLSMMRKTIARRLTESKQTVPHFYLTVDLDADALVSLRESINADLAAVPDDPPGKPMKISINDLLIKACAVGLRRVPACNAQFTPEAILIHRRVDISVAVAIDDGLMTPVVRDADLKSIREISAEVHELAARAREKKLKPEEMTGGTFSISNLGMFGVDAFAAVINPPEGAILAVGQVRREPVVRGDQVAVGYRLACTLSCDHRVVDGAVGASFLRELRLLVEHPTRMLV